MLKIFFGIILIVLETPFFFKLRQADNDFVRQTAIVVIMLLIIPIILWAAYSLSLFVLRLF